MLLSRKIRISNGTFTMEEIGLMASQGEKKRKKMKGPH